MSEDPETLRQMRELARDDRPLLVLDVDDVVLDFIRPFPRFLTTRGFELRLQSFRLHGNIYELASGTAAADDAVSELIDAFFEGQSDWQTVTEGAADALARIAQAAEIVMLTSMPHRYRDVRRAHLTRLGLDYPLLTTEMAKGPAIRRLRGDSGRAVAFVDDQPRNLVSAREWVADARLFHLMADNSLRVFLPEPPQGTETVEDWSRAEPRIARALGL